LNRERTAKGLEPFANPRNSAAGSLKLLDPRLCAERRLRLFTYATGATEGLELSTHLESLKLLRGYGLPVNRHIQACATIDEVIDYCNGWAERRHEQGAPLGGRVQIRGGAGPQQGT
jgi:DNA ligase (NAD+)